MAVAVIDGSAYKIWHKTLMYRYKYPACYYSDALALFGVVENHKEPTYYAIPNEISLLVLMGEKYAIAIGPYDTEGE